MIVKPIDQILALELILKNHYSKIMPRITKHYLGCYEDNKLVGALTLGLGTRPVHTIKKLFPSLNVDDYYEIGRMAMLEEMPRNSESKMLSLTIRWLKENQPQIKVLFTWADGILGKPGYVYQSANFLYGGFIWTDLYITDKGEKIHPRTSQGLSDKGDKKCGHRPKKSDLKKMGWNHYRGKQFRYVYFLGNKIEKKKLLTESLVDWTLPYPKNDALKWKIQNLDTGEWSSCAEIFYDKSVFTKANKNAIDNRAKIAHLDLAREFFGI